MGEGYYLPKEQNSQVLVKAEPYMDTTLESPLDGRRRCTDGRCHLYLSGQWTEKKLYCMIIVFVISSLTSEPEYFCTLVFYLLKVDLGEEERNVRIAE